MTFDKKLSVISCNLIALIDGIYFRNYLQLTFQMLLCRLAQSLLGLRLKLDYQPVNEPCHEKKCLLHLCEEITEQADLCLFAALISPAFKSTSSPWLHRLVSVSSGRNLDRFTHEKAQLTVLYVHGEYCSVHIVSQLERLRSQCNVIPMQTSRNLIRL